jgi:hypothetical protein
VELGSWTDTDGGRLRVDREQFWALVEATRGGGCRQHAAQLQAQLRTLPATEIVAFQRIYDDLMAESYRWDLWGAAYLADGGCSDDGFDYFRGWLLGQGRATWEAVLRDPDSLASHPLLQDRDWRLGWDRFECEDLVGVAFYAYEALTGQDVYQAVRAQELPAAAGERWVRQPAGEDWDFDDLDQMRSRYPRLWSRVRQLYDAP